MYLTHYSVHVDWESSLQNMNCRAVGSKGRNTGSLTNHKLYGNRGELQTNVRYIMETFGSVANMQIDKEEEKSLFSVTLYN